MIKSIRVSGGSLRSWALYGPIDQALKTTCQADAMRCFSLTIPINETQVELDMWINAKCRDMTVEPNEDYEHFSPLGHLILVRELLRRKGIHEPEMMEEEDLLNLVTDIIATTPSPLVSGKAILTGAGGVDIPSVETVDLIRGLLGSNIEL